MSVHACSLAVIAAGLLAGLPVALAQPVAVGPEFQVNTYTTNGQVNPAVAADSAGSFVVVWQSFGAAGSDTANESIQGQRYDSAGAAQGGQFQVNAYTTNNQFLPAVATDGAGNFVVVWVSEGGVGSDTNDSIQGQRYDIAGTAQGGQFQVNTYTPNSQFLRAVAADGAGNFVVVWTSFGSAGTDTDSYSIQGRRYDSAGTPQGGEFQVNTYTTGSQFTAAVAHDGAGGFIVVWDSAGSAGSDTSGSSIQGQRYDSAGTPQGGEFQVNTYTTGYQSAPAVAHDGAGGFVVVWQSGGSAETDTSSRSIQGQRYDGAWTPQGGQFQVNTYTTGSQDAPAVAHDGTASFVVVWGSGGSAGSDTSSDSIQGQRYDSAGLPEGGEFQVNTYTTNGQDFPAVATGGAGNFVVVWPSIGSAGTDTSSYSIQGQRFAVPTTTSTSTTSTTLPPTDYLLPGRITVIKPGTLAKFVAKDTFTLPSTDPVAGGGSLRIFDTATTAGDDTYGLPSGAAWKALGNPPGSKGYRYKGAGTPSDPCKVVVVKETVIKGVCRGSGVTLAPPFTGDVGIVLSLGTTDRYCAQFGGDEVRNDATLTKRKNAPAPGACP